MSSSVTPAVITASVAVIGVVATQIATLMRDRAERSYSRRRAALIDAQDAVLELRNVVRRYGRTLRRDTRTAPRTGATVAVSVPEELADALTASLGRVQVTASRVDDDAVVTLIAAWRSKAQANAVSHEDVTAGGEQAAFDALIIRMGAALRSSKGRT